MITGAGKSRWHTSTINKILRNKKYIGDTLLQKTYTTDFLNKTRVKNTCIVPQYYIEGNHEAIIPKEIYMQVQEELVRRRVVKTSANGKKRSYSCNHCFSQIVICGDCGEIFRRIHWNNHGCKSIVWRCISRLEPTGLECYARTINKLDLLEIVLIALNELLGDKSNTRSSYSKTSHRSSEPLLLSPLMVLMRSLWNFSRSLLKRQTTKKPTMRLPTKFLHSEKSASRPQWTLYSVMSSYRELQNYRILLKTSLPALQHSMKHS